MRTAAEFVNLRGAAPAEAGGSLMDIDGPLIEAGNSLEADGLAVERYRDGRQGHD